MPVVAVRAFDGFRLDPVLSTSDMFVHVEDARCDHINLVQGSYDAGQILGERTAAPGTFAKYNQFAADGTQKPKLVLKYSMTIGANGSASQPAFVNWLVPQNYKGVPAYRCGLFKTTDLVGLDEYAVLVLGRIIRGTLSNGYMAICGN